MPLISSSTMVASTVKMIILIKLLMADVIHTGLVAIIRGNNKVRKLTRKKIVLIFSFVSCFWQKNARVVTIDNYEDVPVNDEKALQKAVANQPVSIAIEGGGREFQLYVSVRSYLFMIKNYTAWEGLKGDHELCRRQSSSFKELSPSVAIALLQMYLFVMN